MEQYKFNIGTEVIIHESTDIFDDKCYIGCIGIITEREQLKWDNSSNAYRVDLNYKGRTQKTFWHERNLKKAIIKKIKMLR